MSTDRTPSPARAAEGRPLDQVMVGASVRIRQLLTGPEVSQRLRELGLGERQVLRLVARSASLICQVCNSRFALSGEVAAQILVEPVGAFSA